MKNETNQKQGKIADNSGQFTPIELVESSAGVFAPVVATPRKTTITRNPMDNKAVYFAAKFYKSVPKVTGREVALLVMLICGGFGKMILFFVWYLLSAVWGFFCWIGSGWGGGETVEVMQPKTTQPTNIIINNITNIN